MAAAYHSRPQRYSPLLSILLIIHPPFAWQHLGVVKASSDSVACGNDAAYCSARVSPPPRYIGSIHTNADLKVALQSMAFGPPSAQQKEIILSCENRPDDAISWLGRFQKAGYAHLLLVGASEQFCQLLSRGLPSLGCGWYKKASDATPEYHNFLNYMIWQKHLTAARAVRMGYNCLVIDSDFHMFDDFYLHVKQPPLSNFHLITQAESLSAINSGFLYAQNVSKSGPVAWAFADAVLRNVRWVSNPAPLQKLGVEVTCWDQSSVHDAVFSAVGRRPMNPACHLNRRNPSNVSSEDWFGAIQRVYKVSVGSWSGLNTTVLPFPVGHPAIVLANSTNCTLSTTRMYMPHISNHLPAPSTGDPDWPDEMGGRVFGDQAGLTAPARAFVDHFLIKDVDAPMWPDPEDPTTAAATAAVPSETFAFAPAWLLGAYHSTGRLGRWHTALTKNAGSVMGHVWAGLPPGDYSKLWTYQAAGVYDYDLAAKCFGADDRAYAASHTAHTPLPGVVAYAPGVINASISHEAFGMAVVELAKLAVAMKRVVGWPGLPMGAPWAHTAAGSLVTPTSDPYNPEGHGLNGKPHVIPWLYLNTTLAVPFATKKDSLAELEGLWPPLNFHGCVRGHRMEDKTIIMHYEGALQSLGASAANAVHYAVHHDSSQNPARGLFPTEMQHYVSKLPTEAQQPGPHNTIQAPSTDGAQLLPYAAVQEEAKRMEGQPIVWLTRLLSVQELPPEQQKMHHLWQRHCCALQFGSSGQTQEQMCRGLAY